MTCIGDCTGSRGDVLLPPQLAQCTHCHGLYPDLAHSQPFIGMYFFGFTLNLMSLVALSLVVGILVDDAIVVIENIHRHMEMGKNKVRAAYDGASEIGFTVTAITLVIVVVFLPIAMATGLVADILVQFCVTVMISTMLSLLVSFTIVPWLFSRVGN